MPRVYLSLGSNKENRFEYIKAAIETTHKRLGTVSRVSDIYETESWSYNDDDYLNCVIEINTERTASNLLKESQHIEKSLDRTSKTSIKDGKAKYSARSIDIDILFYNNDVIKTQNLVIPHPQLHLRNFVLEPMLQLNSDYIHPVFREKIESLYKKCRDKGRIELFKAVDLKDFILH